MISDSTENRFRRLAISVVSRSLAAFIALSFLATLLPIQIASAEKSTRACCVGKAADHCRAAVKSKKSAASHNHGNPSNPAFKSSAIRNLCDSGCCACSASTRQQKRETGTAQTAGLHTFPSVTFSQYVSKNSPSLSNSYSEQTSPRGPPASVR